MATRPRKVNFKIINPKNERSQAKPQGLADGGQLDTSVCRTEQNIATR